MKFSVYQGSRQGPRPYNQDRLAYSYSKNAVLLVLADGMGGHRHGEVAAQLAVTMLTEAFQLQAANKPLNAGLFLHEHILLVHTALERMRQKSDMLETPRTTIVAALIQQDMVNIAHVGDSRLYHFRRGRCVFRTEDHSIVQKLYREGQLEKAKMRQHPDRHKIYNCLGGERTPRIELSPRRQLADGDILMLCSDGLWSAMSNEEIAQALYANPVELSIPHLLDVAERHIGDVGDNMSAIGLQWGEHPKHAGISTLTMPLGSTTTIMNPRTLQGSMEAGEVEADLSDDDIESAIAEIQAAIHRSKR